MGEIVQQATHLLEIKHSYQQPTSIVEIDGSDVRGDDENIYTQSASWLTKALVLDAYEGLVSTASFMIGIGAVKKDAKTMLLGGTVGLVAGASTMMIKKFLSVKSKYDIDLAEMQRQHTSIDNMQKLPNPYSATFASTLDFSFGGSVPLLGGAFLKVYQVRLGVVVGIVNVGLIVFGGLIANLGKSPLLKSSLGFFIGGLLAVALSFGLSLLADRFFTP